MLIASYLVSARKPLISSIGRCRGSTRRGGRDVVARLGAGMDVLDRHGADLELSGVGQAHRFFLEDCGETGRNAPIRREIRASAEFFAAAARR